MRGLKPGHDAGFVKTDSLTLSLPDILTRGTRWYPKLPTQPSGMELSLFVNDGASSDHFDHQVSSFTAKMRVPVRTE